MSSHQRTLDAAWAALDDGQDNRACQLADEVLDGPEASPAFRGEAELVRAHVFVLRGDLQAARAALGEAKSGLPDDGDLLTDAANVALALGAATAAAEFARRALDADPDIADAAYSLALASDAMGNREDAISFYQRTAELDAAAPDPPWAMTVDEFANIAEQTLQELPKAASDRLENVPIIVEPAPTTELIAEGIDPRLFGLFSGASLTERSILDEGAPSLNAIHLFQRNLERACASREELESEIRITVLHETAHFFGLEDEHLHEIGLG